MRALPEEILQHVCINLRATTSDGDLADDPTRLQTLLSLSLANKTCRRIAGPALYHSLVLRDRGRPRLPLLLRTLIECPELPRLVEQVHVDAWETQHDIEMGHANLSTATAEMKSQYSAAASNLPLSVGLRDRMTNGLRGGIEDAELALLLMLCTRLRVLDFSGPYMVGDSVVMAAAAECVPTASGHHVDPDRGPGSALPASPLALVREIRVQHWDTEDGTDLSALSPLLYLPALDTLRGVMLRCNAETHITSSGRSTLRRVYLEDSLVDADGLSTLLTACPQLEILDVGWGDALVGPSYIRWDQCGNVLRRHGSTLTALTLQVEDADPGDDESFELPLGKLRDLAALRRLRVPFSAIFGQPDGDSEEVREAEEDSRYLAESLPTTLRTLRIDDVEGDENPQLRDAQFRELIMDEAFTELTTIRMNRSEPFSLDLTDSGWDDAKSNKFWMVLQRVQGS